MKKYLYTGEKTEQAVNNLARRIKRSSFKPKTIVALARGGLIPGVWLSHKLHKPLLIVSVKSYNDKKQQSNTVLLNSSYTVPIRPPILLVDEICDNGVTLSTVKGHFESIGVEVRTATLLYKPHSIIKPDWVMEVVPNDVWVTFYWEK